jgi:hypothetical protein
VNKLIMLTKSNLPELSSSPIGSLLDCFGRGSDVSELMSALSSA